MKKNGLMQRNFDFLKIRLPRLRPAITSPIGFPVVVVTRSLVAAGFSLRNLLLGNLRVALCTLLCALCTNLFTSCASVNPNLTKPPWVNKRPYQEKVLEGVGFAQKIKDKKQQRDMAYQDAVQKLAMTGQFTVKGVISNYLSTERDLYSKDNEGKEILENLSQIIYDKLLGQKQFAEEWRDPETGDYWVYVYLLEEELVRDTVRVFRKKVSEDSRVVQKTNPELFRKLKTFEDKLESFLEDYKK